MPERLDDRSVLDIGAWDGFFSFEAERRGAARVEVLREIFRLAPTRNQAHNRHFPKLLPLGPFFGLSGARWPVPAGDVVRRVLERT
jgi:hypothetical protein